MFEVDVLDRIRMGGRLDGCVASAACGIARWIGEICCVASTGKIGYSTAQYSAAEDFLV